MDQPSHELASALSRLLKRVDLLSQQNQQLLDQIAELTQQVADLRALVTAREHNQPGPPSATAGEHAVEHTALDLESLLPIDAPPTTGSFRGQISDYEPGMLFEETAFDLTVQFDDWQGRPSARQWGFADDGHLLVAILETCIQQLATSSDTSEFVFRRDVDSATVYARERRILEQVLRRMLLAGATASSTLAFIRQLSPESRQRE
jgi:hypothetical protein